MYTTDYRRMLADILLGRLGVSKDQINNVIFPGLNFSQPLGIAATSAFSAYLPCISR